MSGRLGRGLLVRVVGLLRHLAEHEVRGFGGCGSCLDQPSRLIPKLAARPMGDVLAAGAVVEGLRSDACAWAHKKAAPRTRRSAPRSCTRARRNPCHPPRPCEPAACPLPSSVRIRGKAWSSTSSGEVKSWHPAGASAPCPEAGDACSKRGFRPMLQLVGASSKGDRRRSSRSPRWGPTALGASSLEDVDSFGLFRIENGEVTKHETLVDVAVALLVLV